MNWLHGRVQQLVGIGNGGSRNQESQMQSQLPFDRVLRQLQGNHLRQENGVLLRCGIIPEPVGNIHQQEGKRIKPLQPPDQVAAQHGGPVGIKVKPRLR